MDDDTDTNVISLDSYRTNNGDSGKLRLLEFDEEMLYNIGTSGDDKVAVLIGGEDFDGICMDYQVALKLGVLLIQVAGNLVSSNMDEDDDE